MVRNRTLFAFVCLFCSVGFLSAQTYTMNGTPVSTCGGFFTDSGGLNDSYQNNQDFTTTICSDNSGGSHIKLEMQFVEIEPGDTLCFYDSDSVDPTKLLTCNWEFFSGELFNIQATAANSSGCLTVTFKSNGIRRSQGWVAEILCVRECQTIEAEIVAATPAPFPADTGWIDVCPGQEIFLSGKGNYLQNNLNYPQSDATSDFLWNFGDGTSAKGMNVTKTYDKPGGYDISLTVTDGMGCANSNYIKQRVRVAPAPEFDLSGVNLTLCAGDTISLSSSIDGTAGTDISVRSGTESFGKGSVRSDSLALPDGTGTSYETSIEFTDFTPGQTLTDINDLRGICVNIEHSWMRDMEIKISCPNGTEVTMHNHPGNAGGMVFLGEPIDLDGTNPVPGVGYDYCWTPNATRGTWISQANDLFTFFGAGTLPSGDYSSYENLNQLEGCPLNGEWTIEVTDLWKEDNGFIFSWGIDFAEHLYPGLEEFTPELLTGQWINNSTVLSSNTEAIVASPPNAGNINYTYEVTDEFGCVWDTLMNFELRPETHPDCYTCKQFTEPLPDTLVCEGEQVQLDANPNSIAALPVRFESFPNETVGHDFYPPGAAFEAAINVSNINPNVLSNPAAQIESICFDLNTDFTDDIQVTLIGPSGTRSLVLTQNNGTSGGYAQTCFSPIAVQPISGGSDPFTGDFSPEGAWSDLAGERINGEWILEVSDAAGFGEFGVLNSWSIAFLNQVDITYVWSNPSIVSCNNCPDPMVTVGGATTLTLETTDNFGCQYTDDTELGFFEAPAPVINCGSNDFGQIEIEWVSDPDVDYYEINIDNGTWEQVAGNSYSFGNYNSGDISTIEIRAHYPTVNCMSQTAATACQFVKCEIETVLDLKGISCQGSDDAAVTLTPDLGFGNYQFSIDGVDYQSGDQFSNLGEGNYTAYVLDELNCADTVDFIVKEPVSFDLELQVVKNVSCFGGGDGEITALATGGVEPYKYLWSDPQAQIGKTATQLSIGNFQVTVTDANNCRAVDAARITEPQQIMLSVDKTDINCKGDSTGTVTANFSGGVTPFRIEWVKGSQTVATTPSASNLPVGTYTVIITDANQCTESTFVTLTEPMEELSVTTDQTRQGCDGSAKNEASATPDGGTGIYNYEWSNGFLGRDATNLSEATYFVSITDEKGCVAIDSIDVENLRPITVSALTVPPTCNGGTDGKVGIQNITGGSGIYPDRVWSTNDQGVDFIENLKGDANYSVTITDNKGCEGKQVIYLSQPDSLKLEIALDNAKCYGSNDGSAVVTGLAGNNPPSILSYSWDTNASSQTTPGANNLGAGFYRVTVTDADGCDGYGSAFITQPTEILVESDVTDNNCFGEAKGAIEVGISGGTPGDAPKKYSLEWSNGEFSNVIENLGAGSYNLSVTDDNNCLVVEPIIVEQAAAINADVEVVNVSCNGGRDGEIRIDASGGAGAFKYSVRDEFFTGSSTLIGLNADNYEVIIQDIYGCRWYDKVEVEEPNPMIIDAGPDFIEVDLGDSVVLIANSANAVGDVDFEWGSSYTGVLSCDFCQTTSVYPMSTVSLTLYGEDENGCSAEDRVEIRVLKERKILVPTGFSPNQDGKNDMLLVHGQDGVVIKLFRVFDRWGELLYEAKDFDINNPDIGWDGLFRSKNSNAGVYSWYLEVEYMDGAVDALRGETTLIR